MSNKKEIKITEVQYADFHQEDFKKPSKYYFRNCCDVYVFIHTSSRKEAQQWVDNNYGTTNTGKSKYIVTASGTESGNSTSARCTVSNTSRKGSYYVKIKSQQGFRL